MLPLCTYNPHILNYLYSGYVFCLLSISFKTTTIHTSNQNKKIENRKSYFQKVSSEQGRIQDFSQEVANISRKARINCSP